MLRFRVQDIFLGAILGVATLGFAIFAMGFVLGSSIYPGQPTQSQGPEKTNSCESKNEQQEPWWQRAVDPIAVFTLCLVLVGAVQVGFFYVQLKIIRGSLVDAKKAANAAEAAAKAAQANTEGLTEANRIARQQIELAHRARVSILDATVKRDITLKKIVLAYALQNSGETAATRVAEAHTGHAGPEWAAPGGDAHYISPAEEEFGLILAPNETIVRHGHVRDFSNSQYKGRFYLRVNIAVSYIDGFSQERTTWKWFEYSRGSGEFTECRARQD